MPLNVGDYSDFYASYEHAFNCGVIFRGPEDAMQPNWKHMPVAYHGRASSIVITGTSFHRPSGQILEKPGEKKPIFSACRKLDYELEMGVIFGGPETKVGQTLTPDECRKRTFGLVILNDWSARDIQAWEYIPLGEYLDARCELALTRQVPSSPRTSAPPSRHGLSRPRLLSPSRPARQSATPRSYLTLRTRTVSTTTSRSRSRSSLRVGTSLSRSPSQTSSMCTGPLRRCGPTSLALDAVSAQET